VLVGLKIIIIIIVSSKTRFDAPTVGGLLRFTAADSDADGISVNAEMFASAPLYSVDGSAPRCMGKCDDGESRPPPSELSES